MQTFTDQIGHSFQLPHTPQRIISLVPSQTELLHTLGLGGSVAGITKFCIHPDDWFRTKTRIGGTKDIHPEIIDSLRPDLILAAKEENVRDQVESLRNKYPVWTSDVHDLPSALHMIRQIGALTGKSTAAHKLTNDISQAFGSIAIPHPISATYLIWKDPFMTIGGDTFIHDMLTRAGFDNIHKSQSRYPIISLETLQTLAPKCLLLSSEPYPFRQKHIDALQPLLPDTHVQWVDGEMFSWYGSRLLKAPRYFQDLRNTLAQKFDL